MKGRAAPRGGRQTSMKIADLLRFFGGRQSEPQQTFTQPTTADSERLRSQCAVVNTILAEHYPGTSLNGTTADLALLQRILDDRRLRPDQTYELQSLGIALGEAMANETGLHWIMVEDEYGRDPALQYEN